MEPTARSLDRADALRRIVDHIAVTVGTVARLARELTERIRHLTVDIDKLIQVITAFVETMTPTLIAIPGGGALTPAKILG